MAAEQPQPVVIEYQNDTQTSCNVKPHTHTQGIIIDIEDWKGKTKKA